MATKKMRQKYFVSREIRISIALIILWSLLVTAFFTYFTRELGDKIGHGTFLFVIVMVGYIVIVVVLTMLFSHRLIGPFQRLKTEIRLIITGEYSRRLSVRNSDDLYIKSFISEVNKVLAELEKMHSYREGVAKHIDAEMIRCLSLLEEPETSKEKLREAFLSFHKKIKSLEKK